MAPRKDASEAASIDSFDLPKALVTRLAKSALPPEAKLQKDTVTALVRGATVFINYLAATAQDVAASRSRRTIAGADVLAALEVLAFGDLVPLLERELDGYRAEKENKNRSDANVKGKGKEVAPVKRNNGAAEESEDELEPAHESEGGVEVEQDIETEVEPDAEDAEEEVPEDEERAIGTDVHSDAEMADLDEAEEKVIEDIVELEEKELRHDVRDLDQLSSPSR